MICAVMNGIGRILKDTICVGLESLMLHVVWHLNTNYACVTLVSATRREYVFGIILRSNRDSYICS
jgi:hypothetical protein